MLNRYCNRIEKYAKSTATDANVTRRRWLLLDFDPVRPKDTAATDAKVEAAKAQALACYQHLKGIGWPDPLTAESGNGMHLIYPIDLPNDDESRDLVKTALAGLGAKFDTGTVKLDQAVFNAGRITKLYGTVATKGDHTPAAPWRLSRLTRTPQRAGVVTPQELAACHPRPEAAGPAGGAVPRQAGKFQLTGFLARLGIAYEQDTHDGRERYKLDHCPFNPDHGKGEAAMFRAHDGQLGFKCMHNGCADRTWQDVRALVDGPREQRQPGATFEPKEHARPAPVIVTLEDFLRRELPPRAMLLAPWLPRQGLAMVHAYRGVGKTHFALAVGYAVATGGKFLGWQAPAPSGVLLLDGEMPGPALQERLAAIVAGAELEPQKPFHLMTPDLQPKDRGAFNLARPDDQLALEPSLRDVSLVIVDNLATLCRTGQTNDAVSWLPVQEWALRQRAGGRSVLFVHHSGKSGAQRGTSAKEDVLDTVIGLRRPSDYSNTEGARFEIHFEKARGFVGPESESIEAALESDPDGNPIWAAEPLEAVLFERIIELHEEGLSGTEIAAEVERHKSTVSRKLKQAKAEGRIQ